jgi:hypothetical protein
LPDLNLITSSIGGKPIAAKRVFEGLKTLKPNVEVSLNKVFAVI